MVAPFKTKTREWIYLCYMCWILWRRCLPEVTRNCHVYTIGNTSWNNWDILNFASIILVNSLSCLYNCVGHTRANLQKILRHLASKPVDIEVPQAVLWKRDVVQLGSAFVLVPHRNNFFLDNDIVTTSQCHFYSSNTTQALMQSLKRFGTKSG